MISIPLGADVECTDGLVGQAACVIANPRTLRVTHFVVKEKQRPHTERLVHISHVTKTAHDLIRLDCTRAEFGELDAFYVNQFRQVEVPRSGRAYRTLPYYMPQDQILWEGHERVPQGKVALRQGAEVHATDGKVGHVDELLANSETGQITHFVLQKGHPWGKKDVIMPVTVVDHTAKDAVYLTLDRQTVSSLLAVPARHWRRNTDIELLILTFGETGKEEEVLQALKSLAKGDNPAVLNVAVLTKDKDGKTSFRELDDVDRRHGALFGAITGGLIGLLGGPAGVVLGAATGAAAGGVAADTIDLGFPDEYLKKLQESLEPSHTAVVALVDREQVEAVTAGLSGLGGELVWQTLSDEMVAQFAKETES